MTEVVEELVSPKAKWKVEIRRTTDGNFRVYLMEWIEEKTDEGQKIAEFWAEVTTAASIVDSVERGRSIGYDLLRRHARDEYDEEP